MTIDPKTFVAPPVTEEMLQAARDTLPGGFTGLCDADLEDIWEAMHRSALAQHPRPEQEASDAKLAAFALEAARYFENRPVKGEDSAHWSNVTNAGTMRKIAARLATPAPAPVPVVYDEERRVEVIERDVPVVWQRVAGGALEYALDMDTREIIGARICLPPAPAPSAEVMLTSDERAVLDGLVSAWNSFIVLPAEHPDDIEEFRHGIHALQDKVLSRPTRRALKAAPASETEGKS